LEPQHRRQQPAVGPLLERRWQGACLGASLATRVIQHFTVYRSTLGNPQTPPVDQTPPVATPPPTFLASGGPVALRLAESLVQLGSVRGDGYPDLLRAIATDPPTAAPAMATLPLILFSHEAPDSLDQILMATLPVPQFSASIQVSTRTFARAIATLLAAPSPPIALIPALLTARPSPPSPLFVALQHTQTLLQCRASLHVAIAELSPYPPEFTALSLALYCFLSTPNELALTMRRAARCPDAANVCALAGALSGAHNTHLGIPRLWQFPQDAILDWGLSTDGLNRLIQRLFASWSGSINLDGDWDAAIAASTAPFRR
jgi:ADP-ribosylglycohydrolase